MHYQAAHDYLMQELMAMQMQFPATRGHVENALYRARKILHGSGQRDPQQQTLETFKNQQARGN